MVMLSSFEAIMFGRRHAGGMLGACEEITNLFRSASPYCGAEPTRQVNERRRQG